jgi:hypothetical protein
VKEVQFNKLFNGDEILKASAGRLQRWRVRQGICQINAESESASGDSGASEQFPETLHNVIEDGENNDEQFTIVTKHCCTINFLQTNR